MRSVVDTKEKTHKGGGKSPKEVRNRDFYVYYFVVFPILALQLWGFTVLSNSSRRPCVHVSLHRCISVRHASCNGMRGGVRFHVRDAAGSTSVSRGALHAGDSGTVLAGGRSIPIYIQSCMVSSASAPTRVLASWLGKRALCNTPPQCFKAARPRMPKGVAALREALA